MTTKKKPKGKEVESSEDGSRRSLPPPEVTRFPELAEVPITEVASIAAHLPPETPAIDAVRRAYELLEWAAAAKHGLQNHHWRGIELGLKQEVAYREAIEKEKAENQRKGTPLGRRMIMGVMQPHPFEAVLANIMGRIPKEDRLPRFKWWIMDGHQITNEEAADLIEKWRREGVPDQVYQSAWVTFDKWWRDRERMRLSKQGKAPKKGKQGRVKSKTDKRTGARPDKEKFKKALGVS
jgi:hypothetical protein